MKEKEEEIDTSYKDLSKKYLLVKTEDLNNFIRQKGYMTAKAIPYDDLEPKEKNKLFVCKREYGRDFYDLISELYKIKCVRCLYEGTSHIKIEYYEI